MSFGKYFPASQKTIGDKTIKIPSGYSGVFWGTVYDKNNNIIEDAKWHFYHLANDDEDKDVFDYWDIISEQISMHCNTYIDPYIDEDEHFHAQSGFGGDCCDGLIEFWSPVTIPEMPDLKFKIEDEEYTIKWEFSSGSD